MNLRLALLVLAVAAGTLLSGCEGFINYTVVNNTDQDLITWPSDRSCDASIGKRDDYLLSHVVPMHGRYDYFGNNGGTGPEMRCVYVATTDRRVVDAEPYASDGVFTVNEPLNPGEVFPARTDLPSKSWWDKQRDKTPSGWAAFVFGAFSAIALAAGLGAAAFHVTRAIRRKTSVP